MNTSYTFIILLMTLHPGVQANTDTPGTSVVANEFDILVAARLFKDWSAPNGLYTVFAPNDDAFNALPDGLVECLLEDENKDVLSSILNYHVVSGEILPNDLKDGAAGTLQGEDVTVDRTYGTKINESNVIKVDILTNKACQGPCIRVTRKQIAPGFVQQVKVRDERCVARSEMGLMNCSEGKNGQTEFEKTEWPIDAFKAVINNELTIDAFMGIIDNKRLQENKGRGRRKDGEAITFEDVAVIHVLDAVLVPPSIDVAEFLESCGGGGGGGGDDGGDVTKTYDTVGGQIH